MEKQNRDDVIRCLYSAEEIKKMGESLISAYEEYMKEEGGLIGITFYTKNKKCETIINDKNIVGKIVEYIMYNYGKNWNPFVRKYVTLLGLQHRYSKNIQKRKRRIINNMKFQIRDGVGNIVDKDLSYEAALLYIDSSVGKYYIMEPMKKEDDLE